MSLLSLKEVSVPIPNFGPKGELPPGIYIPTIPEVETIFGGTSEKRKKLMSGLKNRNFHF